MCERSATHRVCETCDHRFSKYVTYHRCSEVKSKKRAEFGTCKRGFGDNNELEKKGLCSLCRDRDGGRGRSREVRGERHRSRRSRRGERGREEQNLRLPWVESFLRSQAGSEAPTQALLQAAPQVRPQARTQPQTQPESEIESEPENHIERVYSPPLQPQPRAQPRAQPQARPPVIPQPPPPHQPQPEPEPEPEVESEPENHIERVFQPTRNFQGLLQPEQDAAAQRPPSPAPTYWTDDSFAPAGAVQIPRPPIRAPTIRPGNGSQPGGAVQGVPTRAPTVSSRAPTEWTADEWTPRR